MNGEGHVNGEGRANSEARVATAQPSAGPRDETRQPPGRSSGAAPWLALWAVGMFYLLAVMLWAWWVQTHTASSALQLPAGQASTTEGGSRWQVRGIERVTQPPARYDPVPGTVLVSADLLITRAGGENCTPSLVGRDGRRWGPLIDYSLDLATGCGDLPDGQPAPLTVMFEVPQSEADRLYGVTWSPQVEVGRQQVLRPAP